MRSISKTASRKLTLREQQETALLNIEPIVVVVLDSTDQAELGVLLRYDPDTMDAPIVVEKGDGTWAQEIQVLADYGIQIVESELLAQVLFDRCDIGQSIPADLYPDVGEMLGTVYQLNEIAARLKDALKNELGSQQSSYGRTHERHSGCSTLARSRV